MNSTLMDTGVSEDCSQCHGTLPDVLLASLVAIGQRKLGHGDGVGNGRQVELPTMCNADRRMRSVVWRRGRHSGRLLRLIRRPR